MSLSVSCVGKPAEVKEYLVPQFESARCSAQPFQHEVDSVTSVENIVNEQLDFLITNVPNAPVRVSASGHAYIVSGGAGCKSCTTVNLGVAPYIVVCQCAECAASRPQLPRYGWA